MNNLIARICKLLTIKSLITLSLTAVIVYKALKGEVDIDSLYLTIVGFYFGTQATKEADQK